MSENSWRNFQSGYILGEKKKSLFCKSKKSIIGMIVFLILIPGIFYFKINTPEKKDILPKAIKKQVQLSKNQLSQIISNTKFNKIDKNIFLTINPFYEIDQNKVFNEISFTHPYYDENALQNQINLKSIQNINNTLFAGSYFGYGFHEDGIKSSIEMLKTLND